METSNISPELILIIAGAILLGVILIRLGRQIAIFLLVGGGIAAVIVVGLAILDQAEATRQAAQVATVASAGQTGATILATMLVIVVIGGGLGIAYLVWRLRRTERRLERQQGQWQPGPNVRWSQQSQPEPLPSYGNPLPPDPLLAPPAAYHPYAYPYPPQMGYALPPPPYAGYHGAGAYPQVIVIDRRDRQDAIDEDPFDLLPLWTDDGEGGGW
jgi:hypothetical protein